jgi:hypothetical protein
MDLIQINLQKLEKLYHQISNVDLQIAKYVDFLMTPDSPEPTREKYQFEKDRLEKMRNDLSKECVLVINNLTSYPYKDLYSTLRFFVKDIYEKDLDDIVKNYSDSFLADTDINNEELMTILNSINEFSYKNVATNEAVTKIIHEELTKAKENILDSDITIKNKLKLTIPIIPFLLSYEAELSSNNKIGLNAIWNKLRKKK